MKNPWLDNVKNWIDERTGLIKAGAEFLHEEIPGGTRFSYTLGSACMFLLTLQIVTGIWQLFFYVPSIDYAYSLWLVDPWDPLLGRNIIFYMRWPSYPTCIHMGFL